MGVNANDLITIENGITSLTGALSSGSMVTSEKSIKNYKTFTRPGDTIAYTAGDCMGSSTAAGGSIISFMDIVDTNGASGKITNAVITYGKRGITAPTDLILFSDTITAVGDNAADKTLLSNSVNLIGKISFPAMSSGADTLSDCSYAFGYPSTGIPLHFKCPANSNDVYGKLVVLDSLQGGAGDTISINLSGVQA